jgi:hypothetical protein
MSSSTSLRNILALGIALFVLVGFNYMQAWTAPPTGTVPPANNVAAPINVGSTYQAKSGDIGAVRIRAGAYCDAAGLNCSTLAGGGSFPKAGQIGSVVLAMIAPSAPITNTTPLPGAGPAYEYNYGDLIEGSNLCPAGFWFTSGSSNNLATFTDISSSGNCLAPLSGTYEVSGFSPTKSTSLSRNNDNAITLFTKISDMCGQNMDQPCSAVTLYSYLAITDLVYQKTGQTFNRIFNGPAERGEVCNLLSPGSTVASYTSSSYGQPYNNNVGRFVSGSWVSEYPATNYNNWINTISCQ